jgi:Tfp pilus assembly protein PilV
VGDESKSRTVTCLPPPAILRESWRSPANRPRKAIDVGRETAGFTIIELLLSLGVFMVGIAGIMSLQIVGANQVKNADDLSLATNLATAKLEEVQVSNLDTLANDSSTYDHGGGTCVGTCYFTVGWTVASTGKLVDIVVTTSWKTDRDHSVTLSSKVVKP